jgi:hypothetical protein
MKQGIHKQLNLPHLEATLLHLLDQAQTEQWTYETLLVSDLALRASSARTG